MSGAEGAMPYSLRQQGLDRDEIWKAPGLFPRRAGGATIAAKAAVRISQVKQQRRGKDLLRPVFVLSDGQIRSAGLCKSRISAR